MSKKLENRVSGMMFNFENRPSTKEFGGTREMEDSVHVLGNQQQQCQQPKYILLPTRVRSSRYSIRTSTLSKAAANLGKKATLNYHDPQGPKQHAYYRYPN